MDSQRLSGGSGLRWLQAIMSMVLMGTPRLLLWLWLLPLRDVMSFLIWLGAVLAIASTGAVAGCGSIATVNCKKLLRILKTRKVRLLE